jgi:ribosomal protein L7/L12
MQPARQLILSVRRREAIMMTNDAMMAWASAAAVSVIAVACAVYYTAVAWFAHRERMAKIEHGLDPDRPIVRRPPSDRVKQLASEPARKIEAIKVYREETGAGLADAKEAIESFIQ